MSVNQVVRSVGFSVGSALGGLILSAHALHGGFPGQSGYTTASISAPCWRSLPRLSSSSAERGSGERLDVTAQIRDCHSEQDGQQTSGRPQDHGRVRHCGQTSDPHALPHGPRSHDRGQQ
jgi:hypothetical protein